MPYSTNGFTNLGQLKKLAQRTKSELDALDTRVGAIEALDPEHNVVVGVQKNGADLTPDANRKVNIEVPTKISDVTNDSGFISETTIDEKISAAVTGALQPAGSITFASLPALAKANCNKIYNVTDAFTTTADFVEGAGADYPAGTNVAIINTGTASSPVYKYDAYTGVIDLSGYATKVSGGTTGNIATLDANGNIVDSGKKPSDFIEEHQDISGKADKVSGATSGNFAALDANGNLVDSGHKHSDYLTAHQDITGKADKDDDAVTGNVAVFDANHNPVDGGVALSALLQGSAATDSDVDAMIVDVFGAAS